MSEQTTQQAAAQTTGQAAPKQDNVLLEVKNLKKYFPIRKGFFKSLAAGVAPTVNVLVAVRGRATPSAQLPPGVSPEGVSRK